MSSSFEVIILSDALLTVVAKVTDPAGNPGLGYHWQNTVSTQESCKHVNNQLINPFNRLHL